jgi:hypothetical protein
MMNFVETAPVTAPKIADAGETPAVESTATPCQKKAFGVSFLMTVAVFSFTLLGLITTTNYITDTLVIPTMYGKKVAELQNATNTPFTDTPDAAVETTSAR